MLDRKLSFVLRNGELALQTTEVGTYEFVGGSPITINTNGKVSGNISAYEFNGVAWNSFTDDDAQENLATFILPPAIVTIKAETDGRKPWKTGVTFAVGDLVRPTTSTGTIAYAVWTNEVYANAVQYTQYTYPAKIIELVGAGANPTSLTLLVSPAYKAGV